MDALFVVCLVGGLVATALLAALGGLGGHLHAGHLHAGPAHGHLPAGGAHPHLLADQGHASALPGQAHTTGPSLPAHGHPVAGSHAAPASNAHQPGVPADSGSTWPTMALSWALSWLSPLTLAGAALGFGGIGLIAAPFASALALVFAIVGAIVGAAVVRALIGAFLRAETPALEASAEGALGVINAPVRADRAGEVVYTLEGLQRSAPARTLDGASLQRGARVVIVRRERGMAWVAPLDPLPAVAIESPPPSVALTNRQARTFSSADAEGTSQEQ